MGKKSLVDLNTDLFEISLKLKGLGELFSHGSHELDFTNEGSYGVGYILRDLAKEIDESAEKFDPSKKATS